MNEYQDQDTWFEVQVRQNGGWWMIACLDTREEAEAIERTMVAESRVRRVRGLS